MLINELINECVESETKHLSARILELESENAALRDRQCDRWVVVLLLAINAVLAFALCVLAGIW